VETSTSSTTPSYSGYSWLLNRCLFPAYASMRGRNYVKYGRFLEESQWWSADRLAEHQWKQIQALVHLAATTVPYYQELFQKMGAEPQDIRSWDDFRKIPVLNRQDIAADRKRFISSTVPAGALLSHATGGSSGVPLRFYRTIDSYDWRLACTRRAYRWANGWTPGRRTLQLWGAPVGIPPLLARWKESVNNAVNQMRPFPTFQQDESVWSGIQAAAVNWRPEYMIGYVSSLIEFCRFLESSGKQVPPVKAILSAAEALTEPKRAYIEKVLQSPLFNTYGSREFMSLAAECEHRQGLHINSENVVVEVAPQATGGTADEASDILITDLHNHATVFLRYRIGDAGVMESGSCSCGRGLPRLRSISGRSADRIHLSDGRAISGLFWPHVLKDVPEMISYQVRQTGPDSIEVLALMERELSERSHQLFRAEVDRALPGANVSIRRVDQLVQTKSGKTKVVIALEES
jgi:phenylacetate-CoA ligase